MLSTCVLGFLLVLQPSGEPEWSSGYTEKPEVVAPKMMVATANKHASKAAMAVLQAGGNALDAAIAAQMVLNVVEPQSSGIGGGGFLLYYDAKNQTSTFFDGRETAPHHFDAKSFKKEAMIGGGSVGTPGLVKMLEQAHREFGAKPWASLFDAAILLAEEGFVISKRLATLIKNTPNLATYQATKAFLFDDDKPKIAGEVLKNPPLAQVFKELAAKGSSPFYRGEIGEQIVETVQRHGGHLCLDDLKKYRCKKRDPLSFTAGSYRLVSAPPPGGGITLCQIVGMMQHADFSQLNFTSVDYLALFASLCRMAYLDKERYVADPDFEQVPKRALLHKGYLKKRYEALCLFSPPFSRDIDNWPEKTTPKSGSTLATAPQELPCTSHLSIVDKEGNMVALTASIENAFGSTLLVQGFFLNNQLTDFAAPSPFKGKRTLNGAAPNKRPQSAMAPTFVFDESGKPVLTIGSSGGARIGAYIAAALLGTLHFDLSLQEAIDAPHALCVRQPIELEKETPLEEQVGAFEERGFEVIVKPLTSGTQGIKITPKGLTSGVDPRREGLAIGD